MTYTQSQQDAIDWAIDKIQKYEDERKLYNFSNIILSILDVICGIIALFYSGMLVTSVVASILCGTAWGSRFIQLVKTERLAKSLKVLTTASLAYIIVRKKRSEYMKNIKIRNWVIAILNLSAIILGVILVFVEPSVITQNIELTICGLGSLLGVNIAIPCFNNAKKSKEEIEKAEQKSIEKEARKELKAEEKKANQTQAEQEKSKAKDEELAKAKAEKEKAEAEHRAKVEAEKQKLLAKEKETSQK